MIEKSISISEQIIKASNEIWKNTKASKDNWILASPKVFLILNMDGRIEI